MGLRYLETLGPLVVPLPQPRALGFLNSVDPLVSASNYVGLRHGEFAASFPGHKEEGKHFSPSICLG